MTYRVSEKPRNPTHGRLVGELVTQGWHTKGWRVGMREHLARLAAVTVEDWWAGQDREDLTEAIAEMQGTPDAWRVILEDERHGWGHKVMVLELAEVEVSYRLPADKIRLYADLWWAFEGSSYAHLRLYRIDRFGIRSSFEPHGSLNQWVPA